MVLGRTQINSLDALARVRAFFIITNRHNIMKKTEFLSPMEKGRLVELSSTDKKAFAELLFEFERLENKIRSLEIAVEVAVQKSKNRSIPNYEAILPIIHK